MQTEVSKHNQAAKAAEQSQPQQSSSKLNLVKLEAFIKKYINDNVNDLNGNQKNDLLIKCKNSFIEAYNSGKIKAKAQAKVFVENYSNQYVKQLKFNVEPENDIFDESDISKAAARKSKNNIKK